MNHGWTLNYIELYQFMSNKHDYRMKRFEDFSCTGTLSNQSFIAPVWKWTRIFKIKEIYSSDNENKNQLKISKAFLKSLKYGNYCKCNKPQTHFVFRKIKIQKLQENPMKIHWRICHMDYPGTTYSQRLYTHDLCYS